MRIIHIMLIFVYALRFMNWGNMKAYGFKHADIGLDQNNYK